MKNHDKDISTIRLTRRNFLKASGIAFGYSAFGSGMLFTGSSFAQQLPSDIVYMNEYEYQVLNHLMDIALPVTGTKLPSPHKIPVMATLDKALLGGMETHILAELKEGIRFFDAGPKAKYQNKHFTELTTQQAVEFCDTWANADTPQQRGIVMGLKKLVSLAYWSNPATWPMLGYLGPVTKRKGIVSLGNAPLPVDKNNF